MCAEANGTIVYARCRGGVVIVFAGRKEPLCIKRCHAVPAAVDRDFIAFAQARDVLLALEVRPQGCWTISFYVAHHPASKGEVESRCGRVNAMRVDHQQSDRGETCVVVDTYVS